MSMSPSQALKLDAIGGRYDPLLLVVAVALASLGVVMVASSSIAVADGWDVGPFHFLVKHLVFLGLGCGLAAVLMRVELKLIERHAQLALLLCFGLLLAVFVPGLGRSVNGAQRWVNLVVSSFQVVEAVKLLFILWLASYLVRYRDEVQTRWPALIKPLLVVGALLALLLLQPDFGSAMLLLAVAGGMLVLGGCNLPRLFAPAMIFIPLIGVVAIAEPYRVRRLTSFLDPWADPFKDGFQLTQALIAIGRGEWFGVGLGGSVQKLFYLPEAHTDFILAVIAEELGFAGLLLVVGLFVAFAWRAFSIGLRAVEMRRLFSGYCAFGVALWISLQALVSIGVNLGLLPTKGLTLPLISYGGSSVLTTCMAVGLLLRVSWELDRAERQVARARGDAATEMAAPDAVAPVPTAAPVGPPRVRLEPTFGGAA